MTVSWSATLGLIAAILVVGIFIDEFHVPERLRERARLALTAAHYRTGIGKGCFPHPIPRTLSQT
jgi:hypothetical protein